MQIIDFGLSDYKEVLTLQEELFQNLIQSKKDSNKEQEYILIGEHHPVITIGRKGKEENVLISTRELDERGIKVYKISRGGDVTYHCPGQIIVYPIIDLEKHNIGVKDYVDLLEESVIGLLKEYGIQGEKIEGATGIWIGKGTPGERKICAIGIKCNRFCTMHGLSLNVKSDLDGFRLINPCGFIDKGVTSIQKEVDKEKRGSIDISKIKKVFLDIFIKKLTEREKSGDS